RARESGIQWRGKSSVRRQASRRWHWWPAPERPVAIGLCRQTREEDPGGLDIDLNIVAALLVGNQSGRGLDDFCNVDRDALSGSKTAEIQQSIRDCLAAKGFIAN